MLNGSEPYARAPCLADNVVRRRGDAIERAGDRDVVDQRFEREDARHDPCIAARARMETGRPRSASDAMTVLADSYDAFLFDLDGVLYRGTEVVPGAPEASPACARPASAWRSSRTTRPGRRRPSRGRPQRVRHPGLGRRSRDAPRWSRPTQLAPRGVSEVFVVGEEGILSALRDEGIAIADVDARSDRGRRRGVGSTGRLREAPPGVAPGATWRDPGGDERRRLVPGHRRELARRGSAARGHRGDDRRASRGVRQAGGAHHARRARTRGRRNAARDRRSAGDGHRRARRRSGGTRSSCSPGSRASRTSKRPRSRRRSWPTISPRSSRRGRPEGSSEPGVCWP